MTTTPETLPDRCPRIWLVPELGDPNAGEWAWTDDLDPALMEEDEIKNAVEYVRADTRPAPVSVKPLDEDDFSDIAEEAHRDYLASQRGAKGQTVTAQDDEMWWMMKATERRILSYIQPAPAVEGLVKDLRRIATERNCGCTPVCRCYEGENGRYQVEGLQDHILAALAAYEESRK